MFFLMIFLGQPLLFKWQILAYSRLNYYRASDGEVVKERIVIARILIMAKLSGIKKEENTLLY